MWTNETIFSEGDLCNADEYEQFINDEYQGERSYRLEHVQNMLERLTAEKNMLKKGYMMSPKFYDEEHENAFYSLLDRMNAADRDVYRQALAYLLTLDTVCSEHIDQMYDFAERCIIPDCLTEGWQTGTSIKTTRLAFNLFNGGLGWCDEEDKCLVTPAELFCCEYAPYYWEAIKLRYPE